MQLSPPQNMSFVGLWSVIQLELYIKKPPNTNGIGGLNKSSSSLFAPRGCDTIGSCIGDQLAFVFSVVLQNN